MIKTVTILKDNTYSLSIPDGYIGKKVEILMYALDEVAEEIAVPSKKTMGDFWGSISDATARELHKSAEESRDNWEARLENQL
jgi:hypothetical protein